MDREQIIKILKEEQYPDFMIENTIAKIEKLNPIISSAFYDWIKKGNNPQIEIEGYTFNQLVSERKMKPVGAFITLDWLIRNPEKAKESLRKGIK